MARRTKEDALATREAILEAAVRVFSVQGVANASLASIAREAGVTRGAIYWHFTNKADLLVALWDQVLQRYTPLAAASENSDEPDPLGKLKTLYVSLLQGLVDDPRQQQISRIIFGKSGSLDDFELVQQRFLDCLIDRFNALQIVLRHAVERQQLPADIDLRLGAMAVLSFINGLIAQWFTTPQLIDLHTTAPVMIEAMLQMLRSGTLVAPNS